MIEPSVSQRDRRGADVNRINALKTMSTHWVGKNFPVQLADVVGANPWLPYLCCTHSLFDDKLTGSVLRAAVARNLRPAKVLPKPRFLPVFQRFGKVFTELLAQRIGVISLPGAARRAGALARAAALSDWLFCLDIKAVCGGGGSD